jgi:hypothetical protein
MATRLGPGWMAPRVAIGLAGLLLGAELYAGLTNERGTLTHIGHDYALYMEATRSWLAGGPFYHPYQAAGPYVVAADEVLYPPHALALFVPFTVLPAIVWWAIPIGIVVSAIWRSRPGPWGWALILACLCIPKSLWIVTSGSPTMWIAAGLAMGRHGWPAVVGMVKPTLLPIALVGLRRRSFWLAAALIVGIDLALIGLSREYVSVVLNARGPLATPLYSAGDLGIVGIALVAWLHDPGHRRAGPADLPDPEPDRGPSRTAIASLIRRRRNRVVTPPHGTFGGGAI